jgi:hypothetical protein
MGLMQLFQSCGGFGAWTQRRPTASSNAGLEDTIPAGLGGKAGPMNFRKALGPE